MTIGSMRMLIKFQKTDDRQNWIDVHETFAYINGVSNTEFFIANAGFDASLTVTVTCRYDPILMPILPTDHRIVDGNGIVYELISPGDDVMMKHQEIKFRARRIYL